MARSSLFKTCVLTLTIFAAARALADDSCMTDIRSADSMVQIAGASEPSAGAASAAVSKCQTGFSMNETNVFSTLSVGCEASYQAYSGTAAAAALAVCKMNAARYVMSLQLN